MPLSSFDTVEWPAVAATALFLLIAIWAILLWRAISVQQQRQSVDESGERLRLAMGAADIGTFAIDFDEGLVRYTPELAGILGFPNLTVGSLDEAFTRVHRDDAAQVRKAPPGGARSGRCGPSALGLPLRASGRRGALADLER